MITFSLNPFERFPRSPRVLFLIYHFMPFMPFLLLYPVSYPWLHLFFPVCIPPRMCMLIDLVSFHRVARGSQPQPAHISPFYSTPSLPPPPPPPPRPNTPFLQNYSSFIPPFSPSQHSPHDTVLSLSRTYTSSHIFPPSRPPALPPSRSPASLPL